MRLAERLAFDSGLAAFCAQAGGFGFPVACHFRVEMRLAVGLAFDSDLAAICAQASGFRFPVACLFPVEMGLTKSSTVSSLLVTTSASTEPSTLNSETGM